LKEHVEALAWKESPVLQFELAVEAIVAGDVATLKALLHQNPELIRARSTREHHATLLHYVGANGVEGYRQKTPKNAVAVAKILLRAGAEVDADLDYGTAGRKRYPERVGSTTLGMVATSFHPANVGVQLALLKTLLNASSSVDGLPGGWNPVIAALHNGRGDAAEYLAKHGARLDIEAAAGTGRLEALTRLLGRKGNLKVKGIKKQIQSGLMWACEYGRANTVEFLLHKGADMAAQPHGETALHWAAYGGHPKIVRLLLKRKAPVDAKDRNFKGTPLGWALYAWSEPPPEAKATDYYAVARLLVAAGAKVDPAWLGDPNRGRPLLRKIRTDSRMHQALKGQIAAQ
jgi:ankyrin repeat protein